MTLRKFIHILLLTSFGFSMLFVSACDLKQHHQRVQKEIIENHRTQQLKLDRTIAFNDTNKVILDSIDWNETMHVFPSGVPMQHVLVRQQNSPEHPLHREIQVGLRPLTKQRIPSGISGNT